MAEPGVGEIDSSVDPIKHALQKAKTAFTKGKDTSSSMIAYGIDPYAPIHGELTKINSDLAQEAIKQTVPTISSTIEEGSSSDDPLAYTLKRIVARENMGAPRITYLLAPPEPVQRDTGIAMVYVGTGNADHISLVDHSKYGGKNPYSPHTENLGRDSFTPNEQLVTDVARIYEDITRHGIRKKPDEFTVIKEETGDEWSNGKFKEFIARFPLTDTLEASSSDKLAEQETNWKSMAKE